MEASQPNGPNHRDRACPCATSSCASQPRQGRGSADLAELQTHLPLAQSIEPVERLQVACRSAIHDASLTHVDGTTKRSSAGLSVMNLHDSARRRETTDVKSKVFVDWRSPVCRLTVEALTLTENDRCPFSIGANAMAESSRSSEPISTGLTNERSSSEMKRTSPCAKRQPVAKACSYCICQRGRADACAQLDA